MHRKFVLRWIFLTLAFLFLLPLAETGAWAKKINYVGREITSFNLPSTEDRLVSYEEYYGKHYLVITFFPAAFTPV
jgi:hypothetical protein